MTTTLIEFTRLFPEFRAASWDRWRTILARLTPNVREFYGIIGRGAGKSRIVAVLACYFASHAYPRAPGESIYIGVFGPDRKQAGITFRYILGLLHSVPSLAALIVSQTKESIELSNGVTIEVITASIAAPRGRAYALVIVEEAAFLPTDASVNPDIELLRSVRPALARVPGSLLAVVSSPYARKGVIWQAWQRHHGKPDGDIVLVQAPTLDLNPTFDRRAIDTAYVEDAASASAEYGAQFRSDVETFVSRDAIDAVVVSGRYELAPLSTETYVAFVDPSGGSSDSMTLAIAHTDKDTRIAILDALREQKPPFSPEAVVTDFAALLKTYHIDTVTGDRYGGEWPRERFQEHGITYQVSDKTKSDIYRDTLPLLNSARVELLDHPLLIAQLQNLERRTARGGRDSIDHAPGAHDDVVNAACGALVNVAGANPPYVQVVSLFGFGSQRASTPSIGLDEWQAREERIKRERDRRSMPDSGVNPAVHTVAATSEGD